MVWAFNHLHITIIFPLLAKCDEKLKIEPLQPWVEEILQEHHTSHESLLIKIVPPVSRLKMALLNRLFAECDLSISTSKPIV